MKKIGILVAVAAILTSMTVPSVLGCLFWTPGYWKNHDWPVGAVIVGGVTCTEAQTMNKEGLLWARPKGDAWIILAQKVIAAQLSITEHPAGSTDPGNYGGYPGGMVGMIADANALLIAQAHYYPGDPGRAAVTELADTIDYWLNYGPYHQD